MKKILIAVLFILLSFSLWGNFKNEIIVNRITINANLDKKMNFTSAAVLDFKSQKDNLKNITLIINKDMIIDSLKDKSKKDLHFITEVKKYDERFDKKYKFIHITFNDSLNKDEHYELFFKYKGDLVDSGRTLAYTKTTDFWYPQYETFERTHFDVTFTYPKKYKFVTVGKELSNKKKGKYRTSHWVTKLPSNFAPFNLGKFESEVFTHPLIPTLDLNMTQNMDETKADVANSISFFQSVYGKCKFDTLTIVETHRFFMGEAYPGLISIYSDDFLKRAEFDMFLDIDINESDFTQLRSHEIAHQWFGAGLPYKNLKDKWLSEGLAEFSSLWYVEVNSKKKEKYFNSLNKWKRAISRSKTKARKESDYPPISNEDHIPQSILYGKSTWVFHMLRYMMIDLNTYDETKFKKMLKEYYTFFKDSGASTDDFKLLVEKHLKMDMTWFFDQWIYGKEIPKFDFDYEITQKKDGKYYAICDIKQEDVSEDFKSYLPIEIDFGDNQFYRFRTLVQGAEKHLEIPLPQEAEKINFNVFNGVLTF